MAKAATKKSTQLLLDTYLATADLLRQAEAARDAELKPHREKFDKASAPILAHYDAKIAPQRELLESLKQEIETFLLADRKDDGTFKQLQLASAAEHEGRRALASIKITSKRVLNPRAWFAAIKEKNDQFWETVTIGIQKADKNFGKANVDKLAEHETSASVLIEIKAGDE